MAEDEKKQEELAAEQTEKSVEENIDEQQDKATADETPEIPNIVTIEDAGPCKKKVIVEIPAEKIVKATDSQFEELRKDAIVPGFRKGRAPRRLLEKRFGKEATDAIKAKLLADASQAALTDNKLQTLGEPDINFEEIELPEEGAMKFDFVVEVRPEFELPLLEGIPVNKTKLEVTDEQVDSEIEQMQRYAGIWTPRKDEPAELDDQIIADAILKIEDVEEAEKLDNTEIFVRKNGFVGQIPVEKLDELLIGAKAGDNKQTSVEVPKTYYKEEYRGKKVDIEIDVKDIKWLKPAELDEAFLQRINIDSEDELRERIQEQLQSRLEAQVRNDMNEQVYQYLDDNINFDLPLDVVAQQAESVLRRQYINLMMKGLQREQIDTQLEQLKAGSEEQAKKQLKTFFIMSQIAGKFDITVTEPEINGYIAQLAIERNQRPEKMREQMEQDGSLTQLELEIQQEKCIAKLLESAKITEKEPEKAMPKAEKAPKKKAATKKPTKKKKEE
ncbi:MAG: trigger factor [Sedimentisphaerales bacterium]|nr:trigger factor [Sedimentisphaerales bacterium]